MASWLVDRVGLSWHVVATDIDTRWLAPSLNLEVRHHNVVDDPVHGTVYDVIHARLVLEHLPQRLTVLAMFFGTSLRGALLRLGLVDVAAEGVVHCLPTADLGPAFLPVLHRLGARIVGTGTVTAEQLDEVVADMRHGTVDLLGYTPLLMAARCPRSAH